MLFKNIIRIITSYKLSLLQVIFFEIIYILIGFKGNKINISRIRDILINNKVQQKIKK